MARRIRTSSIPDSATSGLTYFCTKIAPEPIKQEKFGTPKTIQVTESDQPGVGVAEFSRTGIRCDIPPGLTLLEVAEKNGIEIPYSCRQGQCGTCMTKLTEGAVRMESEVGLSDELKARGTCCPV